MYHNGHGDPIIDKDILTASEVYDHYDQFLDEYYGPVLIAGELYETSEALQSTDPEGYERGVQAHFTMFGKAYGPHDYFEGWYEL